MKNIQRGFIVPLLLLVIAVLLVGGGAYVFTQNKEASPAVSGNVELPQATATEQTTTVTTQTTSATQPSVTVLSPNGGETWKVGQVYTISWQPAIGVGSIQIIADKNALCGEAPCLRVHDEYIAEGVGKYTFTLNDIQPGKYYVRLNTVVGGPTIYSNQFTIATAAPKTTSPSVTILSPKGGANLKIGQTYTITWSSSNMTNLINTANVAKQAGSDQAFIYLVNTDSTATGGWNTVAVITAETAHLLSGSYDWTIPSNIPAASNYKIRVGLLGTSQGFADGTSATPFSITQ